MSEGGDGTTTQAAAVAPATPAAAGWSTVRGQVRRRIAVPQGDEDFQGRQVDGAAEATQRVLVHDDQCLLAPGAQSDADTGRAQPAAAGFQLQPVGGLVAPYDGAALVGPAAAANVRARAVPTAGHCSSSGLVDATPVTQSPESRGFSSTVHTASRDRPMTRCRTAMAAPFARVRPGGAGRGHRGGRPSGEARVRARPARCRTRPCVRGGGARSAPPRPGPACGTAGPDAAVRSRPGVHCGGPRGPFRSVQTSQSTPNPEGPQPFRIPQPRPGSRVHNLAGRNT